LSDGAILVRPTALEKAVMHHALAKEEKDDGQEDCKQALSNSERGWLSLGFIPPLGSHNQILYLALP
jgi:hypothetical protein